MSFDILIRDGRVVDGTGNPWFWADVGIKDGRIAALGNLSGKKGEKIIDASGLVVTPGFIDVHTHTDAFNLINPTGDSFIMQGVTTHLIGNCGGSVAPVTDYTRLEYEEELMKYDLKLNWSTLGEFLDKIEKNGVSLNVATLVGQGTVRKAVMGMEKRPPTEEEMEEMKSLVAEAMDHGAFGLSTGLWYAPSGYADTDEVVELAKVVAEYGGIYVTHMRSEENKLAEAVWEAIEIGERGNIPVQISHFKAAGGRRNWGKVKEALKMMEEARKRGVEITCDVYSWRASSTGLTAYLPHWVHEGGIPKLVERLTDPEMRPMIKKDTKERELVSIEDIGWENVMVSNCFKHRELQGKNVSELAAEKGVDPYDFAFDLLVEEEGRVGVIVFEMDPEDVAIAIKSPLSMMASDGSAIAPTGVMGEGKPHPRSYGNFVNVLGEYVREKGVLRLEEAVRKMTSMPANKFGFLDRGLLRRGFWADVVVLDPERVTSRATYMNPHRFPEGVKWVIVNGIVTVEEKKHTGARGGKVLRKKSLNK